MRVGFGATVLVKGLEGNKLDGIGYYSRELAASLCSGGVGVTPVVFGSNGIDELFGARVSTLPGFRCGVGWGLLGMGYPAGKRLYPKIDLYHATDHLIPRLKKIPVVATIMDAIPLARPQWTNRRLRYLKNYIWKRTISWADHFVTISEYSRNDLVECFGIAPENITVTPLGVSERYFDSVDAKVVSNYLGRMRLRSGLFFLFVGTLQPRKNVETILAAYLQLPIRVKDAIPLIVVGREGWGCSDIVTRLIAYSTVKEPKVRWFRSVTDEEKRILMQNAAALVFPSLYEGFGLPVLEAFASSLPVITSNTTSLPEVALDAALLVDPTNVEQLTHAMNRVVEEEELRIALKSAGLARARTFTWARCAAQTLAAYRSVSPT